MTIHLPQELETFIESKVQSGRFASEDEAVAEAVRLLRQAEAEREISKPNGSTPPLPGWQRLLNSMSDVPDEAFDAIPTDASSQLDHYVYGTPRRPTP